MSKLKTHKTIENVAVEAVATIDGMTIYKQVSADDMSFLFFVKNDEVRFTMGIKISEYCGATSVDNVVFQEARKGI